MGCVRYAFVKCQVHRQHYNLEMETKQLPSKKGVAAHFKCLVHFQNDY